MVRRNRAARGKQKRGGKTPLATPDYLRNWALRYLDRYSASTAHLRRLMLIKIGRSAKAHGSEETADAEALEAVIDDLARHKLLDDAAYAAGRARSLARRGTSARAIRAQLKAKGLSRADIDQALAGLREIADEPELAAALAYARRRRLGPYRAERERAENRERDLAALARRGFGYDIARRIIEAEDLDGLEREAGTGAR